jgi:methylmalonyl-CoA mutase N-terminal domain/subunit
VLGGTQSLHTNALDEVLALPSDHAAKVALRTQQVIAEETGVTNVIDPLGGSWFVEWLTDEIERQAEDYFAKILDMGTDGTVTSGILRGIDEGWFMSEIADAAFGGQVVGALEEDSLLGGDRQQFVEGDDHVDRYRQRPVHGVDVEPLAADGQSLVREPLHAQGGDRGRG